MSNFKAPEVARTISISPTRAEEVFAGPFQDDLKELLFEELGNVDVHLFGSRVIGVSAPESDLDIFVDVGGKFDSSYEFTFEDEVNYQKIEKVLNESRQWKLEFGVRRTAVPILKAVYLPFNLNCDISITNGVSVRNSEILKHIFQLQPEAVKFVHYLKKWMENLIDNFKGFKRYTLTLLVLFYLQQEKVLPSVETVQKGVPIQKTAGWRTQFDPNRNIQSYNLKKMENFNDYTRSFFIFYSRFDYNKVISTNLGEAIRDRTYRKAFPKLEFSAISIPGPINMGKVCQRISSLEKSYFVKICVHSKYHLTMMLMKSLAIKARDSENNPNDEIK